MTKPAEINEKKIKTINLSDAELQAEIKRRKSAKTDDRNAYKQLVQEELPKSIDLLKHISQKLSEAKTTIFRDLANLIEFKTKAYSSKSGQQSHTFSLDNGDSITIGYRVTDAWDDTVGSGISKVNEYLVSLATDKKTGELVEAVNLLLQKDPKGNLKSNRVLELQKLSDKFNSDLFTDGVDIIRKAYKPLKSVYFIDGHVMDSTQKKQGIPLSISAVSFTSEIEINF